MPCCSARWVTGSTTNWTALCVLSIRTNVRPQVQPGSRWDLMKEGLSYVWTNKIVFGAISLDLFAVLMGVAARAVLGRSG